MAAAVYLLALTEQQLNLANKSPATAIRIGLQESKLETYVLKEQVA